MRGHTSWVNTVSFSPDGKQLLTGGYDRTARLWASDTGENRFVLGGHRGGIHCAVFSPDGKAVATCDEEVARLWDASSGKLVRELTGHTGTITDAVFSPTGSFLVTATGGPTGDSSARIWEVASGRLLSTVNQVQGATFGSEDRLLLTVDTKKLARIQDWQSDVVLAEFVMDSSAQWSPDGRFALIQAVQDELQLRNAITGKLLMNLSNLPLAAVKPVFSRDGQLIVVGGIDPHARLDGSTDFNLVRIYACDVCAPFGRLLALARQRLTRTLSPAERQIYLHERIHRSTSPP
jgi:WD40 repeat protein